MVFKLNGNLGRQLRKCTVNIFFFLQCKGVILLHGGEILNGNNKDSKYSRKPTSKYTRPYRDCEEPGTVIRIPKLTSCVLRILYLGETKKIIIYFNTLLLLLPPC